MRTSLSGATLSDLSLEEAISTTAAIGYDAIEMSCGGRHLDYETVLKNPEGIAGIAEQIRNAGLAVSSLFTSNNFTLYESGQGGTPPNLRDQVKMAETFIGLAQSFDTKLIQMTTGRPPWRDAEERHWKSVAAALREIVPMAEDSGVKLTFHTNLWQVDETLAGCERLLEMAPSDCVGITVDVCNLRFAGETMPRVFSRLKDRIYNIHVKNGYIDSKGGMHFTSLDTGLTDWPESIALLQAAGYEGYLNIECLDLKGGPYADQRLIDVEVNNTQEHEGERLSHPKAAQRDLAMLNDYLEKAGAKT